MKPSDLSRSKIGSEPQRFSMVMVVTKCLCYLIVRLPGWGESHSIPTARKSGACVMQWLSVIDSGKSETNRLRPALLLM